MVFYALLGPKARISYPRLAVMQLKSFISRLFDNTIHNLPYTVWSDTKRVSFPALNLSRDTKVQHFGGSLHPNNSDSPSNYFAITCQVQSSVFDNYPKKILHDISDQKENVIDFIFQFEDSCRPLGAFRMTHLDPSHGTLLETCATIENTIDDHTSEDMQLDPTSLESIETDDDQNENKENNENDKPDVDALKEILSCITVPVRIGQQGSDGSVLTPRNNIIISKDDIHDVQVLSLLSDGDLRRHLIASRFDLKETAVRIVQCAAW